MKDLIEIKTSDEGKRTINARDLYVFLGSRQDFSDWIKGRVQDYGFNEGQDFTIILGKSTGGRPSKEYHISLDMAKELSMVERNEKGKQARQYFIECERRAKDPMVALNDPAALRSVLLTYSEKVIALEKENQAMTPKVAALDRIAVADGSMNITAAAKHLQVRPKDLFSLLLSEQWIYRRTGNKNYLGYQTKIQQGLIEHKITTIDFDGHERVYEQARITPKGLCRLAGILESCNERELSFA